MRAHTSSHPTQEQEGWAGPETSGWISNRRVGSHAFQQPGKL